MIYVAIINIITLSVMLTVSLKNKWNFITILSFVGVLAWSIAYSNEITKKVIYDNKHEVVKCENTFITFYQYNSCE